MIETFLELTFIAATIVLMLYSKNKCVQENDVLSSKSRVLLALITIGIFGINLVGQAAAYYLTQFPDDKYRQVQAAINYHLYKPTVLPGGRQADTAFVFYKNEYAGKDAVRVMYSKPITMEMLKNEQSSSSIIFLQGQVEPGFDLEAYVNEKARKDSNISKIVLANWTQQPAFIAESDLLSQLYVLTPDNVLVSFIVLHDDAETLIEMAESLQ